LRKKREIQKDQLFLAIWRQWARDPAFQAQILAGQILSLRRLYGISPAKRRLEMLFDISKECCAGISVSMSKMLESEISDEILANSLFYYCCGKDPTPIAAFGADIPLYIYSDLVGYGRWYSFGEETQTLYKRLGNLNFELEQTCRADKLIARLKCKNAEITEWKTQENKVFYLAYIQHDAYQTYHYFYFHHYERYYFELTPLCICNHAYEFEEDPRLQDSWKKFSYVEKRVKYVIGYCFECGEKGNYKQIGYVNYYGDYWKETEKIPIYQRRFWYMK
jgi:hypothetical protein